MRVRRWEVSAIRLHDSSTSASLALGLGHHALNRHGLTPLPLALIGRFHEGEDLDRLLGTHRRFAGLEELDDLDDQWLIAAVTAAGAIPLEPNTVAP